MWLSGHLVIFRATFFGLSYTLTDTHIGAEPQTQMCVHFNLFFYRLIQTTYIT